MSAPNSSRIVKSLSGNGADLPHMQSCLSPQGFGLYNSNSGKGDAPSAMEGSPNIASGLSPLQKQTISYNDYLTSIDSHRQKTTNTPSDGNWRSSPTTTARGNENLTMQNSDSSRGCAGSHLNTVSVGSNNFGKISNPVSANGKTAEKSYQNQQQYLHNANPNFHTSNLQVVSNRGNAFSENVDLDRDRKKDRLIDSLSNSDMITCLPGFKKRAIPPRQQLIENKFDDNLGRHRTQPDIMAMNEGAYASTLQRGPKVAASSYARQTPASLSQILNFKSVSEGEVPRPSRERVPDIPRNAATEWAVNSQKFSGNFDNDPRCSRPASPISRAKLAVGVAQSEIAKINSFVDEEKDRRKPHGTWKNMGTPFNSEYLSKSAQKQQKFQYRLDLERQIQACKLRKAEEERKQKDCNDHPLGPEYARPALTYYNPPHRIISFDPRSVTKETATAAVTKYIKEKYALGVSSSVGGNAIVSSSGYPPETGGSTTVLGRAAPHQKKKDKAITNLMKSRMHPGDQNQSNASPPVPMNQFQTGGATHPQQQIMQPGNGSRFPNQMQQQSHPHKQAQRPGFSAQFAYPTGPYPARPYGIPAWPMPMYPPCNPYYGPLTQSAYPSATHGPVNSQQPTVQHQQQPPQQLPQQPPVEHHGQIRHDQHLDEADDYGADTVEENDDNFEYEALKEMTSKAQKIWQTSDELPDPGLKTAVYKVELRKQIDEDRKRKAERVEREREEDERIERKIREFHEEEQRRMLMERQTRAEFEEYHRSKAEHGLQQQKVKRRNEALTVSQRNPKPPREMRPRSRSSLLAEKLARYGPEAGDFVEPSNEQITLFKDKAADYRENESEISSVAAQIADYIKPLRKGSPPVPVVQRKLIENYLIESGENVKPRQQISSVGQDFLFELKTKLKSERDFVERRLKEKVESTHKNISLLKYTMTQ